MTINNSPRIILRDFMKAECENVSDCVSDCKTLNMCCHSFDSIIFPDISDP